MIGLSERAYKGESDCDDFQRQLDLCRETYVRVLQVKLAPERSEGRALSEEERLHILRVLASLRRLGRRKGGKTGRAALDLCAAVETELLECRNGANLRSRTRMRLLLARRVQPFWGRLRSFIAGEA